MIVDDDPININLIAHFLGDKYQINIATNGEEALEQIPMRQPDLILLDIMMPVMDGYEVCQKLKDDERTKNIPVIFLTGMSEAEDETKGLEIGAVDYIKKPIHAPIFLSRVQTHLELKKHRDHLEHLVADRTEALKKTFEDLQKAHEKISSGYIESIFRLTLAAEYKDVETGEHIKRVSYYTKELALALGMENDFVDCIYHAAPMHDLGKVGIPDSILLKPGKLTDEEWGVMRSHTTIGGEILKDSDSPYLVMAKDIAIHHHERWSGGGYPYGLQGDDIPLPARLMNLADQYDALRSKRPYKQKLTHNDVVEIIIKGDGRTTPEDFDPQVLDAFKKTSAKFDEVYESI